MSDDDSNSDVVMVENTSTASDSTAGSSSAQKETRPLMKLLHRLVSNDNKQNTILTNAQIVSILLKEFDIDIVTLHELEVDIYLNVVKRFLKDWPQWDEFDQHINMLRKKNAQKSIKKVLEFKYEELKEYLGVQLEATKPLAQKAVKEVIEENAKCMEDVDTSDVVLEVCCTRKQLYELVLSHPLPGDADNNIFHVADPRPSTISINKVPLDSILNWCSVRVTIDCQYLSLTRHTDHELKHTLVNAKLGPRNLKQEIITALQYKETKRTITMDKQRLFDLLNNLHVLTIPETLLNTFLVHLRNSLTKDFESVTQVNVPGSYRQNTSKYPYYRKLRKQLDQPVPSNSNLDLYVEEVITPMHYVDVARMYPKAWDPEKVKNQKWLTVECAECNVKFDMENLVNLKAHYDMYHGDEPPWTCTNCERTFSMNELARNHWVHDC